MASKVEVGFELTVGDTPYFRLNDPVKGKLDNVSYRLAGPIWIDISDKVSNVSIKRGKNRELDRYSSAAASIALHNEDRTFDPLNTASPYVGNIIPRRSVRVSTAGVTQFTGVIEDWNLDYDVSGKSNAVIQAADAFTLLAQQSLTAGTATSELTGARVNAVLSQPSVAWPLANRQIDVGNSLLGADVFDGNVLSYLQQVEASEQGQLFMSKGGDVRFVNGSTSRSSGTWTLTGTNLVTNPSMETVTSGAVVMRRNLVTNPNFEATGTTGWTAIAGTTMTRDTTTFYSGSASLKLVTAGSAGSEGAYSNPVSGTVLPGGKLSVSAWVKAPAGAAMQISARSTDAGTSVLTTSFTGTGNWQLVKAEGGTAGATGSSFIGVWTASAQAITFYVDNVMIEGGSTVGDYFDGSTTDALGWDYAWSGTANASISTASCAATTVRTNLVTNPSFETNTTGWFGYGTGSTIATSTTQKYVGANSLKVTTTATGPKGTTFPSVSVTAGASYTFSAWIYREAGSAPISTYLEWFNGATYLSSTSVTQTVPTGVWTRVSMTATAPATATLTNLDVLWSSATTSDVMYIDAALFEASSTVGDYFDGSLSPAGDFSYAWTGTANASTSIQRGATVVGWTGGSAIPVQARGEKYVGSSSLAVFAKASDQYGGSPFFTVNPSTTYTASAWVKGTVGKAVYIGLVDNNSGGQTYGTPVTMTGAWQRISVTRTISAVATGAYIFIRNGSFSGVHTFYVDAVLLDASPTVNSYYDGSTTPADNYIRYAWTGTANASTSTKEQLIAEEILQFADDGTGIPYTNASVSYGTELLYNQVSVTYPGGSVTANNTASQTQYGISTTDVDTLLSNSTQAQTLADFWVAKYGQPEYRFQELTVNLTSLTGAQQAQILNSELGDIISVKFTPNGVGDPIERNGQIVAISHNIGIDRHDITYGFAAVPFTFFVLNDEGYGILDSSALGF